MVLLTALLDIPVTDYSL